MPTLYAARGGSSASSLYSVNSLTGAATAIGPTGRSITGLAIDPTTGTLYGITGGASPLNPRNLVTVNKVTGAVTVIGPTGQAGSAIADIAFKSDGTLYGYGGFSLRSLYTINKATGAATLVGTGSTGDEFGLGFEIDAAGYGYVFPDGDFGAGGGFGDRFFQVDLATGALTQIGTLQNFPFPGASGAVSAASFGPAGDLWFNAMPFGAQTTSLGIVTPTGVVTDVGDMGFNNFDALAWDGGVKPNPWYGAVTNDFDLTLTPTSVTIPQIPPGATVALTTTITSGVAQSLALSATSVPTGVTVTFDVNPIMSGDGATITVVADFTSVPGTYTVFIHAIGPDALHDAPLTVIIIETPRARGVFDGGPAHKISQ